MNISRNFLLMGIVYLLIGMLIGMYMGGSENHELTGAHAHINLVGFALMTIFALVYRVFPEMGNSGLARPHFWLHQAGTLILTTMLVLVLSGTVTDEQLGAGGILFPISETLLVIGTLLFGWNALQNAK